MAYNPGTGAGSKGNLSPKWKERKSDFICLILTMFNTSCFHIVYSFILFPLNSCWLTHIFGEQLKTKVIYRSLETGIAASGWNLGLMAALVPDVFCGTRWMTLRVKGCQWRKMNGTRTLRMRNFWMQRSFVIMRRMEIWLRKTSKCGSNERVVDGDEEKVSDSTTGELPTAK